jgi:hypothetical protein
MDNRVELATVFDALPAGAHVIKVWRLDDNVVLEGLDVLPR